MKSITSKVIAAMVILAVTGLIITLTVGAFVAQNAILKESFEKIKETVYKNGNIIDGWISQKSTAVSSLAMDLDFVEDHSVENLRSMFIRHEKANAEFFSVYLGLPDGIGIFSDGWEPDPAAWQAYERPWYKGALTDMSRGYATDIYIDAHTGMACISIAKAFADESGGAAGVVCADIYASTLQETIFNLDAGKDSYAFLVNGAGDIMIHPIEEYAPVYDEVSDELYFKNINDTDGGRLSRMWSEQGKTDFYEIKGSDGIARYYAAYYIGSTGWTLYTAVPESTVSAPVYNFLMILIPIALVLVIIIIAVAIPIQKYIDRTLNAVALDLSNSVNSINSMAGELSNSSHIISSNGSEQAASLEETAAAVSETAGKIERNSENTRSALSITQETARESALGTRKISDLHKLMDELAQSSGSISNVINTISGIASQTNILALNASVEAVRVGESGKGFAVVAEEVRTLAHRSNEALQNVSAIIENNAQITNQSIANFKEVGEAFDVISAKVDSVNQIVAKITTASEEQAQNIQVINAALTQMEKNTQANAAISQESEANAAELKSQADTLNEIAGNIERLIGMKN